MAHVFGVFFVGKTSVIGQTFFQQVDPSHWVLDVSAAVTPQFQDLKEVSLFLLTPNVLPPDAALALYVSLGGADWTFRGHISNAHPSEVMPLSWPDGQQGRAQIGVSLEPLAEACAKQGQKVAAKGEFCKRVGMDLFQYLQSFGGVGAVGPNQLLVPADALDKWFTRITRRLERDPDFLTRNKDVV